jgi:hypothetical protein
MQRAEVCRIDQVKRPVRLGSRPGGHNGQPQRGQKTGKFRNSRPTGDKLYKSRPSNWLTRAFSWRTFSGARPQYGSRPTRCCFLLAILATDAFASRTDSSKLRWCPARAASAFSLFSAQEPLWVSCHSSTDCRARLRWWRCDRHSCVFLAALHSRSSPINILKSTSRC